MWGLECWRDFLTVPAPSSVFSRTCLTLTEWLLLLFLWCKADPVHLVLRNESLSVFLMLPRVVAKPFLYVCGGFCVRISQPFPNSSRTSLYISAKCWVQQVFWYSTSRSWPLLCMKEGSGKHAVLFGVRMVSLCVSCCPISSFCHKHLVEVEKWLQIPLVSGFSRESPLLL